MQMWTYKMLRPFLEMLVFTLPSHCSSWIKSSTFPCHLFILTFRFSSFAWIGNLFISLFIEELSKIASTVGCLSFHGCICCHFFSTMISLYIYIFFYCLSFISKFTFIFIFVSAISHDLILSFLFYFSLFLSFFAFLPFCCFDLYLHHLQFRYFYHMTFTFI